MSDETKPPSVLDALMQEQEARDVIRADVVTDPRPIYTFKAESGRPIGLLLVNDVPVAAFSDPKDLAEFLPGPALYQVMGQLLAALEGAGGRGEDAKRKLNEAVGQAVVVMGMAKELRNAEAPRLITLQ